MSGHSKWSQIKRQKGVTDARRGQLFTKLGREITLAARQGGDPEANFRLRLAIQRAREYNMPQDNIERAVKRGVGEVGATSLTEVNYEGYGPGGIAFLLQVLTDNRNRALQEIRNALSRGGGSLGESGCVAWLFEPHGIIILNAAEADPEELALYAIDLGAEDVKVDARSLEIHTRPEDLERLRKALEEKGFTISSAELTMVPKTSVPLDEKTAVQALRLLDKLEELDEVQRVYSNADFPDAVLEKYEV